MKEVFLAQVSFSGIPKNCLGVLKKALVADSSDEEALFSQNSVTLVQGKGESWANFRSRVNTLLRSIEACGRTSLEIGKKADKDGKRKGKWLVPKNGKIGKQ